ncbi:zinc-dependent metalloprotease [Halorhabdus rudnickae]|uniref:zinc-dependent metalloprotease n=1 Tax=Halorhabdus rudnickae TaxID=1775544 RepID=UPI0010848E70|nr:zinc-dependent metalloprotease [Halorhabdus rudnickae]
MNLIESVRTVADASGTGPIDWESAAEAATAATDPGDLSLAEAERDAYAADVRAATEAVGAVTDARFDVPESIQILNRHHWIEANVETFERVMAPVQAQADTIPGVARTLNTGTMAVTLGFLGRHVLGQYDPVLLAEDPHELYFVHPNIVQGAKTLDVPIGRFRRWIAFHEVTHAAEFGAAPWLPEYLESRLEGAVEDLSTGTLDREAFRELDAAMTAVEGYAELLMDRAFDRPHADLRDALDRRRQNRGPIAAVMVRVLGLGMKRRQYERGKAFFEAVEAARGIEGASAVWEDPSNLPTDEELDTPAEWLGRVDP